MQHSQREAKGCIEASNTVRCSLKFLLFFVSRVRCMISRDAFRCSIYESGDHGRAISLDTQGGIHFGVCVVIADRLVS